MKLVTRSTMIAAAALGLLAFAGTQTSSAPNAPATLHFMPASPGSTGPKVPVDPNTQMTLQVPVLQAAPGVYDRVGKLPDGKPVSGDQIYEALTKAGAKLVDNMQITTTAGAEGTLNMQSAIPYNAMVNGEQKVLSIDIGSSVDVTPWVASDGSIQVSASYTRTEAANDTKPGNPPATTTTHESVVSPIGIGQSLVVGDLKPTPGYGQPMDDVVFVRLVSVKHVAADNP